MLRSDFGTDEDYNVDMQVQLRKRSNINRILKVSCQMIFESGLKVIYRVQVVSRLKKVSAGKRQITAEVQ